MRYGFTLLELSVALVLTGLVAALYINLSKSSVNSNCYVTTKAQMETIKQAIERFAMKNDRFPVPAARNSGVQDINYGREAATPAVVAAGTPIPVLDENGGVLFGALPFQALGIPVEIAADCWGHKYSYAVTADLIDTAKFLDKTTDGRIKIKTSNTITFLPTAGYVVISHGQDGLGAVKNNYSGMSHGWCTSDGTLKTQNCDVTNTDVISAEYNDGKSAPANYFDDIIIYRGKPWRQNTNQCACKGPGPIDVYTTGPNISLFTAIPDCM